MKLKTQYLTPKHTSYPLLPTGTNLKKISVKRQIVILSRYLVIVTGLDLSNDPQHQMANFVWAKHSLRKWGLIKCIEIIDYAWESDFWREKMYSFKFMFNNGLSIWREAKENSH